MNRQQRLVVVVSILASFVAFLDSSVVNVALPAISRQLGGGLVTQQWVVDAYLITLGSLILIAGSLSDIFGRKRVLQAGLLGFGITSLLCAVAPNASILIVSRGLQGVAGALLVPSSLALIMSAFSGEAQGKAIGTWTGWTGMAFVVGPLLGGFLVDAASWRLIFAINLIPIAITLWLMKSLHAPKPSGKAPKVDTLGAVLGAVGLGGPVYGLIEKPNYGWGNPLVYLPLIIGLLIFCVFLWHERRTKEPMLPLSLFKIRNFSVGNLATVSIYAGLSVALFLVVIFLQQVGNYSAILSGLALVPVTLILFVLSSRFGALSAKYGPRFFMAVGPVVAGLGFLSMLRVHSPVHYWSELFPGIIIFGVGLSMTVAPLTSAILGAIDKTQAGIGSAINNAVSRVAGLVAIASIGVIIGPSITLNSFHRGVVAMVVLLGTGGVISAIGIQNKKTAH